MVKNTKKVLIIGGDGLTHYRLDLFNLLCENYDLTVAHSGNFLDRARFEQITVLSIKKGPFLKLKNVPNLSSYDAVIFSFNLRVLDLYKYLFRSRTFKLLFFGIGVSASYNNNYDEKKGLDFIRRYLIKKSDGAIFYEHYPLVKYQSYKIDSNKLHVAYNTIMPPNNFNFSEKTFESFMFIGTLYKQKKIYDLLDSYLELFIKMKSNTPKLEIVGDGDEFNNIEDWIIDNGLKNKVILHGKLTDEEDLSPIFKRALACISPGQAGLSVQKCFSYGTPFITVKNAITGGELFCIIDKINGFLYDGSIEGLSNIMFNIATGVYNIKEVSEKAYSFYYNFRTPQIWKMAFCKAIG
ncbi:glycosyltransferase [Aquimarina algiphila]|uniref:glycosyltransferase n=1 Tax=Aquimarina algiphila TaxID=2047982 RepID=UPI00232E2B77|nr:glycosyltransferase [Aquimarina algiphila]